MSSARSRHDPLIRPVSVSEQGGTEQRPGATRDSLAGMRLVVCTSPRSPPTRSDLRDYLFPQAGPPRRAHAHGRSARHRRRPAAVRRPRSSSPRATAPDSRRSRGTRSRNVDHHDQMTRKIHRRSNVSRTESTNEPRQPSRLEKKRNTHAGCPTGHGRHHVCQGSPPRRRSSTCWRNPRRPDDRQLVGRGLPRH
jgi:hypothetical protein